LLQSLDRKKAAGNVEEKSQNGRSGNNFRREGKQLSPVLDFLMGTCRTALRGIRSGRRAGERNKTRETRGDGYQGQSSIWNGRKGLVCKEKGTVEIERAGLGKRI